MSEEMDQLVRRAAGRPPVSPDRIVAMALRIVDEEGGTDMAEQSGEPPNRLELRKARTRAALVQAAQAFIAAGRTNVAVLEITQAADVGTGSFYNHFQSKEERYRTAVEDALDVHGALHDELTGGAPMSLVKTSQGAKKSS